MNTKAAKLNINERVAQLIKEGVTEKKVIQAHLVIEEYKPVDITKALKEAGLSAKKASFANDFYDWLVEEVRSEEEVMQYVMGTDGHEETTANIQKHKSHYINIADMARAIHETK